MALIPIKCGLFISSFFDLKKNAGKHKLLDYVLILEEVTINKIKRMSRMKKN